MRKTETFIPVRDYDLAATLSSGQSFRWRTCNGRWEGIIGSRWVQLSQSDDRLRARVARPVAHWHWLTHYLQTEVDLAAILRSFPDDPPLRASGRCCRGLRLLRQDAWECLASFIASSTKQIVQIQQIIALLCRRFGRPVPVPRGHEPAYAFPTPQRLAAATELELRECKLGFRAPHILAAARRVASGALDLQALSRLSMSEAQAALRQLPGVGEKIANCVLLFAYDFPAAFPVDVWVNRALTDLYFSGRRASRKELARFIAGHFGPQAGYAQQYLFHYVRTQRSAPVERSVPPPGKRRGNPH